MFTANHNEKDPKVLLDLIYQNEVAYDELYKEYEKVSADVYQKKNRIKELNEESEKFRRMINDLELENKTIKAAKQVLLAEKQRKNKIKKNKKYRNKQPAVNENVNDLVKQIDDLIEALDKLK